MMLRNEKQEFYRMKIAAAEKALLEGNSGEILSYFALGEAYYMLGCLESPQKKEDKTWVERHELFEFARKNLCRSPSVEYNENPDGEGYMDRRDFYYANMNVAEGIFLNEAKAFYEHRIQAAKEYIFLIIPSARHIHETAINEILIKLGDCYLEMNKTLFSDMQSDREPKEKNEQRALGHFTTVIKYYLDYGLIWGDGKEIYIQARKKRAAIYMQRKDFTSAWEDLSSFNISSQEEQEKIELAKLFTKILAHIFNDKVISEKVSEALGEEEIYSGEGKESVAAIYVVSFLEKKSNKFEEVMNLLSDFKETEELVELFRAHKLEMSYKKKRDELKAKAQEGDDTGSKLKDLEINYHINYYKSVVALVAQKKNEVMSYGGGLISPNANNYRPLKNTYRTLNWAYQNLVGFEKDAALTSVNALKFLAKSKGEMDRVDDFHKSIISFLEKLLSVQATWTPSSEVARDYEKYFIGITPIELADMIRVLPDDQALKYIKLALTLHGESMVAKKLFEASTWLGYNELLQEIKDRYFSIALNSDPSKLSALEAVKEMKPGKDIFHFQALYEKHAKDIVDLLEGILDKTKTLMSIAPPDLYKMIDLLSWGTRTRAQEIKFLTSALDEKSPLYLPVKKSEIQKRYDSICSPGSRALLLFPHTPQDQAMKNIQERYGFRL